MAESIYFDTCALNRLTDDQAQPRVAQEAEAVSAILDLITDGSADWFRSEALRMELTANPHEANRSVALAFLALAQHSIQQTPEVDLRAAALERQGFGTFDALHVALAESARIDWLLTVDDRLVKAAAARTPSPIQPAVLNPVEWLRRRSEWLLLR